MKNKHLLAVYFMFIEKNKGAITTLCYHSLSKIRLHK